MAVCDTVRAAPNPELVGGHNSCLADKRSVHEEARVEVEAAHCELMFLLGLCPHVLAVEVIHRDDVAKAFQPGPPRFQVTLVVSVFGFILHTRQYLLAGLCPSKCSVLKVCFFQYSLVFHLTLGPSGAVSALGASGSDACHSSSVHRSYGLAGVAAVPIAGHVGG